MKERRIILRLIIALSVWLSMNTFIKYFLSEYMDKHFTKTTILLMSKVIIPYFICLPIFYLIIKDMKKIDIGFYKKTKFKFKDYFEIFIMQYGVSIIVILITSFLLSLSDNNLPSRINNNIVFYSFLLLIFNPIFEEVVFRKMLLSRLYGMKENSIIIISSILFSVPHLFSLGLSQMMLAFVSALFWGYMTIKTKSILPAIVLHSLTNFFMSFLTILLSKYEIIIMTILIIVPIYAIFIFLKRRKAFR